MHFSYTKAEGFANSCRPKTAGFCFPLGAQSHFSENRLQSHRAWVFLVLPALATVFAICASAQQSEPTLPISQRQTINLAAGVPEYVADSTSTSDTPQSHWLFQNTHTSPNYATAGFVESSDANATWTQVGLPYDANIPRTFINQDSGGGQGSLTGQENWYRLHFKIDPKYAGQKFLLNVEGSHTAVQVYINGTLLPGVSAVAADAQATHVVGFIPVIVDLTPYLHTDGVTDNVIAIDVSRGANWFEQPAFSGAFRFGQAMAGLFRNVYLYVTNPVHIPVNVYSNQKTWGTYVGTVSEVPAAEGTATAASAVVEVETNVLNESQSAQQVTLTTQIVDAKGNVVVTAPPMTQTVPAMTPATFPSGATPMFDQKITVPNPTLWYPNDSTFGTSYLYRVYHIVSVNGVVVDSAESTLGIRTITWDANFPYFNGHAMHLWGGSSRYDYPALGSSVPDEQWWRDMAQIAAQGGNVWRPGHSTSSEEMVAAADAYGIMIDQPSGDGEGYWNASSNPTADDLQLKQELHRDMIIRDRSHPSILDWERDNGGMNPTLAGALTTIENTWDNINPRVGADRAYSPAYGYMDECDGAGCEAGNKEQNPNNPAFGAEYWDNMGTGRGLAWDYELVFAAPYLDDWRKGREANAFGMAQWYFAESPGEDSLWAEYQNQPAMQHLVRSLGYSSTDANRFPRLLYYIYQANWMPYSIQPVVHLAHHWNRSYEYTAGTPIQENAFSNCPSVRLLINGVSKDPVTGAVLQDQVPNPWNVNSSSDLSQSTTVMPAQVHWMVNWAPGTVTAECIDANGNVVPGVTDARTTAGAENKIVLSVVPEVTKPNGTSFQWTANGSDAAFVVAQVEDANGNLVPTAADNVTFAVTGAATYMGGTQQLVADPTWTNDYQDTFSEAHSNDVGGLPYGFFHSPGDPELNFEGGLQKIALRSTFTPGTATVTASAQGLASSSVILTSVAPPATVQSQPPAIIVPPVNTATTVNYPATFSVVASGSGTLSYQWSNRNGAIAGATSSAYTTPATTLNDNGNTYTVTVSSGFGSVTADPVTLTVDGAANVAITTQPTSQAMVVGQSATLSVVATGSPTLTYQWYQVGVGTIAGATQSTYTTPVFTATGTASFYVVVGNPIGQLQSNTAVVTINAPTPVSFTTQPASSIVPVNQPVQLTAVVAGSAPYTYQWQFTPKGGTAIILTSGTQLSNTISYTIPAVSSASVGAYTVTVNNAANQPATSAAAQITLAPPGVNLALDKTATSSSTQNACNNANTTPPYTGTGCLGPENAVDGSLTTRWGSATANAPPTPPVTGIDPSWLQVDLGSAQSFNTIIIDWENAYATQYQILYTNSDPSTNPTWNVATTNNSGAGGTENLNFSTVNARYIRMNGIQRATQYGYSIYEFQVYNVAQCGGPNERYTVNSANPNLVTDNQSGLTWTRTIETDTAPGSQFTGIDAQAYCTGLNMRLPTQAEAMAISGVNNASCAFPGVWSTWTSTVDPNDATKSAIVNFDGTSGYQVTNNYPGATLCVSSGTGAGSVPVITMQPGNQSVTAGQTATFSVAATGTGTLTYQWSKNGAAITGATASTYTTSATTMADNGAAFSVLVGDNAGSTPSNSATLTVTAATGSVPVITTQPANQSVTAGQTATFSVTATGTGTLTYQWSKNGAAITGATASTYTTPVATTADNGATFSVVVGDSAGTTASSSATLTVTAGPPADFTLSVSAPSLTVTAGSSGTETVTVTPENGFATTSTVTFACSGLPAGLTCSFSPTTVNGSGNLVSTMTVGAAASSASLRKDSFPWFPGTVLAAFLCLTGGKRWRNMRSMLLATSLVTLLTLAGCVGPVPPKSTTAMVTVTATSGSLQHAATFSLTVRSQAVASATPAPRPNSGASFPPFELAAMFFFSVRRKRRRYRLPLIAASLGCTCLLIGCVSPLPSSNPQSSAPSITTQPANQSVTAGQTATFSVVATGTGTLTYQWSKNGAAISGATAANYTTPATSASDSGSSFTVVVTNSAGSVTSNAATLSVTTASCNAVPGTPSTVAASAVSSSQISITWTASTSAAPCIVSYNVYRSTTSGFAPSNSNQVATGLSGTSFGDSGLATSTTYYYAVVAVDSAGSSPASAQASATTQSTGTAQTEIVAINSGGPAVSNSSGGDTSFAADEYYSGGGTSANNNVVAATGVTDAAPEAVYQSERNGTFTYTIPGLAPGAQYQVLLHFAETYFTAAGQRVFNVAINGTQVLKNFDIYVQAGANTAVVEHFTATANSNGQIVVAYTNGTANQPKSSGIEVRGAASACTVAPTAAPAGLAATATSPSIVNLSWSAVAPPPNCATTYNVYQSTTSGFTPSPTNLIASGVTGTTYSSTGLAASTTYYYAVAAVDAAGASSPSAQASTTTHSAGSCASVPQSAPTGLAAIGTSSTTIALTWTPITPPANCTNVTYNLYASRSSGFVPSASNEIAVGLTGAEFVNNSLPPSTAYYYVVTAADEDGASTAFSSQVSATTLAPEAALSATVVSANEIDLSWPASTAAAPITYRIFRSTTSGFTPSGSNQIGTTKSNWFQDVLASASTNYYYMVQATGPSGNQTPLGPANATTFTLGANPPFWNASNMPAANSGDAMEFKFLNRTNGVYTDDQITWSATINGVITSNTIAAQPTFSMPANASGRMYFYLGHVGQGSTDYYDFIEYTIGTTNTPGVYFFNGDTTRVDAFGVKLAFQLTCGDGTNIAVGENAAAFAENRASTFQRYLNAVPPEFQPEEESTAPYRILEPGAGGFNAGGPYQDYYSTYISQIWASNGLTIPIAGPNGSGLTNYPNLSAAIYRHTAGPGTFNSDGTLISQAMWGNPSTFYQTDPSDHYAEFMHSIAINGQQYAFPYDDAGGYSSDVSCNGPQTLLVAIGW
jgi:beta-galactosidase